MNSLQEDGGTLLSAFNAAKVYEKLHFAEAKHQFRIVTAAIALLQPILAEHRWNCHTHRHLVFPVNPELMPTHPNPEFCDANAGVGKGGQKSLLTRSQDYLLDLRSPNPQAEFCDIRWVRMPAMVSEDSRHPEHASRSTPRCVDPGKEIHMGDSNMSNRVWRISREVRTDEV